MWEYQNPLSEKSQIGENHQIQIYKYQYMPAIHSCGRNKERLTEEGGGRVCFKDSKI